MAGWVGRIDEGETLSAAGHFAGPWREFSRRTVQPGETFAFDAADAEYAVIVMSGTGEAEVGARTLAIRPGSSLTIGYRAQVVIRATDEPVEVFITTVDVRL